MTSPTPSGPCPTLLLIRISDSNSIKELTKLTMATAEANRHLPGADLLHRLGGSPLTHPDEVGARLHRGPQFRAATYRLPGTQTVVLQALGSATKSNVGEDDNAFVELLAEVTAETEFDQLVVADFARLLRSLPHLSKTWMAARRCRTIRHGGSVIDTSAPGAESYFMMEAMRAVADAQSMVKRTQEGKIRAYLRGECVINRAGLPLGYIKTRNKTIALARPTPIDVVSAIIDVLGDPALTNRERVHQVSEAGGHSVSAAERSRRRVPYAEMSNPQELVERWYRYLDVWRTGEWSVKVRLPALLDQLRIELPIELREDETGRYYWMHFEMPTPEDGWATPEQFEAAVDLRDRRRRERTPTGGASVGSRRKPLTGLPAWIDGDFQYKLLTRGAGMYELRRRPKARATRPVFSDGAWHDHPRGWGHTDNGGRHGEVIATVPADRLHRSVTEGLVQAATAGLDVRKATQVLTDQPSPLSDDLRTQLAQAKRTARNARANANEAGNESLRRSYNEDAQHATNQVEALERELLRVASLTGEDRMIVDVDAVALALGRIADVGDHVGASVADAVREVVVDFRLALAGEGLLRWQASLRVPMAGGVLVLGPAGGTLSAGSHRALAGARTHGLPERAHEAATFYMRDGLDIDATSERLELRTTRRVAQTIRDHLKALGMSSAAASMLLAATPTPARQAVWARLTGRPYPQDISPHFAAHAARAYLDQPVIYTPHRPSQEHRYQDTLDLLIAEGGWVPAADEERVLHRLGISATTLHYYLHGRPKHDHVMPAILRRVDDGFGLIPCPHADCGGWADVARVLPEVATRVLCSACRRLPDPQLGKLVFPAAYLPTAGAA